ncbi:helix-turn-helix domain-containing protein [Pseudomonas sp. UL073]|uniref:Helix-turn-helix domain-containing protein n=1 Tax=Zestomonas insulae TaxID=2809017 RepID=A0ABS2IE80_9GAMM|nr:helix-turn-helix domain-containing protein [Pseudomonas insulae]MBM7060584.1 helix-turn-helix domain-containing protein [Pseudomonas insulae]
MAAPLRIGLLLYPDCMPAGLFAFADLLHASNRRVGRTLFEARHVALHAGPVACAHGVSLLATDSLERVELDALLVPGFWAESAPQVDALLDAHLALVRALAEAGKRLQLWSYCTGVCLLAAAGRLNGQPATVTWWLAETMRQRHAKVHWQSEQNCIFNAKTATASGVNGYLPIAQALIERRVSAAIFRDLTRLMVLPRPALPHAAFQGASLMEQSGTLLRQLHALIEQLPAEQIRVAVLASRLGISERTLARRVSSETGRPLATFARRVKLNQVSERLTLTALPVSSISAELGFSSDSNLRRMFKELTGLTPAEYRQKFARL